MLIMVETKTILSVMKLVRRGGWTHTKKAEFLTEICISFILQMLKGRKYNIYNFVKITENHTV